MFTVYNKDSKTTSRSATLLKCESSEISKNNFLTEHVWATVSGQTVRTRFFQKSEFAFLVTKT